MDDLLFLGVYLARVGDRVGQEGFDRRAARTRHVVRILDDNLADHRVGRLVLGDGGAGDQAHLGGVLVDVWSEQDGEEKKRSGFET